MNAIALVGWLGAFALLVAYFLLTAQKITPRSRAYTMANAAGSAALAINGVAHSAWPSAALNLIWLVIAVAGAWPRRQRA